MNIIYLVSTRSDRRRLSHGSTISSADCLWKLNHAQKVGQLYRSADFGLTVAAAVRCGTTPRRRCGWTWSTRWVRQRRLGWPTTTCGWSATGRWATAGGRRVSWARCWLKLLGSTSSASWTDSPATSCPPCSTS